MGHISTWIHDEFKDKSNGTVVEDTTSWPQRGFDMGKAKQGPTMDCGIYIIMCVG